MHTPFFQTHTHPMKPFYISVAVWSRNVICGLHTSAASKVKHLTHYATIQWITSTSWAPSDCTFSRTIHHHNRSCSNCVRIRYVCHSTALIILSVRCQCVHWRTLKSPSFRDRHSWLECPRKPQAYTCVVCHCLRRLSIIRSYLQLQRRHPWKPEVRGTR